MIGMRLKSDASRLTTPGRRRIPRPVWPNVPGALIVKAAVLNHSFSGSAPAGLAPAGLASAEGILTGHLYAVGGPAPGARRPWPGTVTLTGPGFHRVIQVSAGGGYSARVPAGTYAVAGRSPLYQSGAGSCRAAAPATVTSGHRTEADVLCQLR